MSWRTTPIRRAGPRTRASNNLTPALVRQCLTPASVRHVSERRLGEAVSDPRFGETVPDPRLGEAGPPGTFADSELEYPRTEWTGEGYDQPGSSESEGGSTVDTAKSEAANIKDTAAGAASGVKDVAKSEVCERGRKRPSIKPGIWWTRRGPSCAARRVTSSRMLASKLNGWASELGSMASKSDESGPMTDLAQEASRRVGEFSHWLDNHEPADLLDEVKRFARRRPGAFLALAAAAGVVAGRLTRGAVAANTSVDSDTDVTPARAYDSGDLRPRRLWRRRARRRLWGTGLRERL